MQHEKAQGLQKSTKGVNCPHPKFEKEYMKGMQTGDYVCTSCGQSFMSSEVDDIERERSKK